MKHISNKTSALIAGILAGMSAPGSAFSTPNYPALRGNDVERMRQSVCRVGEDFSKVMNAEASHPKTGA
ncbi:MAG: hypothetical protein NT159_05705 [Proteobacteria bacterium]|nr:hypothetical protein [Pseudomonadota bacterium]